MQACSTSSMEDWVGLGSLTLSLLPSVICRDWSLRLDLWALPGDLSSFVELETMCLTFFSSPLLDSLYGVEQSISNNPKTKVDLRAENSIQHSGSASLDV